MTFTKIFSLGILRKECFISRYIDSRYIDGILISDKLIARLHFKHFRNDLM